MGTKLRQRYAEELNLPRIRCHNASHSTEQGGFSGAVGADDAVDFARSNSKVHATYDGPIAVTDTEIGSPQ